MGNYYDVVSLVGFFFGCLGDCYFVGVGCYFVYELWFDVWSVLDVGYDCGIGIGYCGDFVYCGGWVGCVVDCVGVCFYGY